MSPPLDPQVVDTNVPLTANKKEPPECVLACVEVLRELMTSGHLVIDDQWRIISEYKNKLSPSGQPGVGDRFLRWVLLNHANPERCTHVPLTPKPHDPEDFEEFPNDKELERFDRADRKFVAVSCAHPGRPPILQASDSKWWGWKEALMRCGVNVDFLCPEEIQESYERKFGR